MQKREYCIFTIIYWYVIICRNNVTLGDGMDYRLEIWEEVSLSCFSILAVAWRREGKNQEILV